MKNFKNRIWAFSGLLTAVGLNTASAHSLSLPTEIRVTPTQATVWVINTYGATVSCSGTLEAVGEDGATRKEYFGVANMPMNGLHTHTLIAPRSMKFISAHAAVDCHYLN